MRLLSEMRRSWMTASEVDPLTSLTAAPKHGSDAGSMSAGQGTYPMQLVDVAAATNRLLRFLEVPGITGEPNELTATTAPTSNPSSVTTEAEPSPPL